MTSVYGRVKVWPRAMCDRRLSLAEYLRPHLTISRMHDASPVNDFVIHQSTSSNPQLPHGVPQFLIRMINMLASRTTSSPHSYMHRLSGDHHPYTRTHWFRGDYVILSLAPADSGATNVIPPLAPQMYLLTLSSHQGGYNYRPLARTKQVILPHTQWLWVDRRHLYTRT